MLEESRREDAVRRARERLIVEGLVRASLPVSLVAAEIEQSWRRSVSQGVNPGAEPHILGEINPDSSILRAAGRILDQWQTNLTDSRLAILLADEGGRIVSRRIIDRQDERALDRANAVEGFDFSEQTLGTNGLGTPIEARGVVFVRGNEHFNDALAHLACAGAPIKHPITGRIVGSLSIASHIDASSPLMVAMVRQAGQQIAEELESMADSRDLELARTYRSFRSARHPVLVMNSETVMTDMPALAHFDADSHANLWERLRRHPWEQKKLELELPLFGADVLVTRFGRTGQDAIFALEFIQAPGAPAPEQSTPAHRKKGSAPLALGRLLDGIDSLPPRREPYEAIQRQFTLRAADNGLIRVSGGPGTGKQYQASRWLRQHTGQDPVVFTGHGVAADGTSWTEGEAALHSGRGIIVIGGNNLSGEARERLETFSRFHHPSVHPGARVFLTELPGGQQPAADVSAPVCIPPLAERRSDLPEIMRQVSLEAFPGAPAPHFSPEALQCLCAWRWPGNVAELLTVLASLPARAGDEPIHAEDLPGAIRHFPRSSLSRYEQAERDAIGSALREADGNKSRAAEILGIGRTTLYRKMRSLRLEDNDRTRPRP